MYIDVCRVKLTDEKNKSGKQCGNQIPYWMNFKSDLQVECTSGSKGSVPTFLNELMCIYII